MAKRFPVAEARIFTNIYICMKCNARNRTSDPKRIVCRKCGYRNLRLKNKEMKR